MYWGLFTSYSELCVISSVTRSRIIFCCAFTRNMLFKMSVSLLVILARLNCYFNRNNCVALHTFICCAILLQQDINISWKSNLIFVENFHGSHVFYTQTTHRTILRKLPEFCYSLMKYVVIKFCSVYYFLEVHCSCLV